MISKFEILSPAWVGLIDDPMAEYLDTLMLKFIGHKGKIYLLNPTIVHAVNTLAEYSEFLDPLSLHDKDIIVVPIIENPDGYKVGGSHWSLLVLIKSENRFYYDDSMNNYNQAVAKVVFDKITSYFSMQAK